MLIDMLDNLVVELIELGHSACLQVGNRHAHNENFSELGVRNQLKGVLQGESITVQMSPLDTNGRDIDGHELSLGNLGFWTAFKHLINNFMDKDLYLMLYNLEPTNRDSVLNTLIDRLDQILQDVKQTKLMSQGIFMAVWNSDKPVNQLALNQAIAKILHCLSHEQKFKFMSQLMRRLGYQWHGIDYWRTNKYLQLVRILLQQFLNANKRSQQCLEWLVKNVLCDREIDQLTNHILDIYIEVLQNTGGFQTVLLRPLALSFQTQKIQLQRLILQRIFIKISDDQRRLEVVDILFAIGKDPRTSDQVRRQVYAIGKFHQSLAQNFQQFAQSYVKQIEQEDKPSKQIPKRIKKIQKIKKTSAPLKNQEQPKQKKIQPILKKNQKILKKDKPTRKKQKQQQIV